MLERVQDVYDTWGRAYPVMAYLLLTRQHYIFLRVFA